MKRLIIINGVMGVIGSPLFSYFAESEDNIVWGISRRGLYFDEYVSKEGGTLPQSNIVFSLGDYRTENNALTINSFMDTIPDIPIVFIHAMGKFVTEINEMGNISIENDYDDDGINDEVKCLTYDVPLLFAKELQKRSSSVLFIQIGSLSDSHNLELHSSWVKSIGLLKEDLMRISEVNNNFKTLILNVSSVLTPKELIDRPFISIQTDADMKYWLPPTEIARFIDEYDSSQKESFFEKDLYRSWPDFSEEHFSLNTYKERRKSEFYNNLTKKYEEILHITEGDSITYSLSNAFHMDRLWGDLTMILFKEHDKSKPIFFYNPHNWFFIVRNKTEHKIFSSIQDSGGIIFLTSSGNTKLDVGILEKNLTNYKHKYVIAPEIGFDNNYNLNIYGDFIIEIIFDKGTANKIDGFYDKYVEITQENILELKNIVSKKGDNKLIISRDRKKSLSLRSLLMQNFKD
ncbi:MAG: hypothetical protein WD471_00910 [Candidatus Paceibacterota bacterium]